MMESFSGKVALKSLLVAVTESSDISMVTMATFLENTSLHTLRNSNFGRPYLIVMSLLHWTRSSKLWSLKLRVNLYQWIWRRSQYLSV